MRVRLSYKLRSLFVLICAGLVIYLAIGNNWEITGRGQVQREYSLVINEVMLDNRNCVRDEEGDFKDWIEIYNFGETAINLNGFGLSNDTKHPYLWTFPDIIIAPKGFCVVWASEKNRKDAAAEMHTSFKLKSKDKVLLLTAPDGGWSEIFVLTPMGENISYGRMPDGGSVLCGFDEGSPGSTNLIEPLIKGPGTKRLDSPIYSRKGGLYGAAFNLTLSTVDPDAEIYYTLDGSVPNMQSQRYTKALPIFPKSDGATVVRARAYKEGYPKSEIATQSYFVGKDIYNAYNIPIISLVTDPENLFDYEKGIYVSGKIMDKWLLNHPGSKVNKVTPANYNQRGKNWEREGSIELVEPDGRIGLLQDIGIRISGDTSRANLVKSFSIRANNDYDSSKYFAYDFFHEGDSRFSKLLLRSSGSDSEGAFFRDAFIQSLVTKDMRLDTQRSRPCILFINGIYYGIRNIREDYDKYYISQHYNVDEEAVVMIKNPTGVAGVEVQEGFVGDEMHYNQMISYLNEYSLIDSNHYDYMKTRMDIDNFIEYNILQIYCDNDDWPGGNTSVWRKRTKAYESNSFYGQDGRWRWLVYDLDHGFGLLKGIKAVSNNSLSRAVEENGPSWPNPPWSTLLLRSLLENQEFRNQFINTFADRLNTTYSSDVTVKKLNDIAAVYSPYIKKHITRWNLHDNKVENWEKEIEVMRNFALKRPDYVRQHIVECFGLSGTASIEIRMSEGGSVRLNTLNIKSTDAPWKGLYFKDIPIIVEAIPNPGFVFCGWGGSTVKEKSITINLSHALNLRAEFKREKAEEGE